MSRVFGPNKHYKRNLLNRLLRKERKKYLGNGSDSMVKLSDLCNSDQKEGGTFIPRHCNASLKLTEYSLQTPLEKN